MAEDTQQAQDGSKTIVSFVVGLLIGGMLVWAFSGPADTESPAPEGEPAAETDTSETQSPEETETDSPSESTEASEPAASLPVGDGSIVVNDQPASSMIELESATYPVNEGWIGVRDYNNGQLGFILGVVRFSEAAGLVPENIVLQRSTQPGEEYAVVVFTEDGSGGFNPAGDVQVDQIFATFTAQ